MASMRVNSLLSCIFLLVFAGCGGGSSDEPNKAPSVTVSNQVVEEGTTISVTANATDVDGSIASYVWSQKSGEAVTLSGSSSNTVNINIPLVSADSTLVLTVLVTDNEGATASADVTITIQNLLSLTLQGLVTSADGVSSIQVDFAEKTFNALSDDNGAYSIALSFVEAELQEMVKVTATSNVANSPLKFASLLGDLALLTEAAGDDAILDVNENFAVNLSSITTAVYGLKQRSNDDQPIADMSEFYQSAKLLDSFEVMAFAVSIQAILADEAELPDLVLPDGINNTLELAQNYQEMLAYYDWANRSYGDNLISANLDINTNLSFFNAASSEGFADTFHHITPFTYQNRGRIELNSDGAAKVRGVINGIATWTIAEEGIAIDLGEEGIFTQFATEDVYVDGVLIRSQVMYFDKNYIVSWLTKTEEVDLILIKKESYKRYINLDIPDAGPFITYEVQNVVKNQGVRNAGEMLQLNQLYSFPIPLFSENVLDAEVTGAYFHIETSEMTFEGSIAQGGVVNISYQRIASDGTLSDVEEISDWSINTAGNLVISGEANIEYAFLNDYQGIAYVSPVITFENYLGDLYMEGIANYAPVKTAQPWTNESAVGIYDGTAGALSPLEYFWIEVYADGTAKRFSSRDRNTDGIITDNEVSKQTLLWQVTSVGNLLFRNYDGINCTQWEPAFDSECQLFQEREWELFTILENGQHHLRQDFRFYYDFLREQEAPGSEDHLFSDGYSFNRYWTKLSARPVEIIEVPAQTEIKNTTSTALSLSDFKSKIREDLLLEGVVQ